MILYYYRVRRKSTHNYEVKNIYFIILINNYIINVRVPKKFKHLGRYFMCYTLRLSNNTHNMLYLPHKS